jgi:hypothetical protein
VLAAAGPVAAAPVSQTPIKTPTPPPSVKKHRADEDAEHDRAERPQDAKTARPEDEGEATE